MGAWGRQGGGGGVSPQPQPSTWAPHTLPSFHSHGRGVSKAPSGEGRGGARQIPALFTGLKMAAPAGVLGRSRLLLQELSTSVNIINPRGQKGLTVPLERRKEETEGLWYRA